MLMYDCGYSCHLSTSKTNRLEFVFMWFAWKIVIILSQYNYVEIPSINVLSSVSLKQTSKPSWMNKYFTSSGDNNNDNSDTAFSRELQEDKLKTVTLTVR